MLSSYLRLQGSPPCTVGKCAVLCNLQAVQLNHRIFMANVLLDAAQERLSNLTLELVSSLSQLLLGTYFLQVLGILDEKGGQGESCKCAKQRRKKVSLVALTLSIPHCPGPSVKANSLETCTACQQKKQKPTPVAP